MRQMEREVKPVSGKEKNMRKIRNSFTLRGMALVLLIPFFLIAVPSSARAAAGRITVRMEYEGTALQGGTIALYRVGDTVLENGAYAPVLSAQYAGSGVDLFAASINQNGAKIAETLLNWAKQNRAQAEKTAEIREGRAVFSGLPHGFYLAVQEQQTPGYTVMSPFIVMLPVGSETGWEEEAEAIAKLARKSGGGGNNGNGNSGGGGNGGGDGGNNGGRNGGSGGDGSETTPSPVPDSGAVKPPVMERLPKTGEASRMDSFFRYVFSISLNCAL